MVGCFGLSEPHHPRVRRDLMVEANLRLDVFLLHRTGALVPGTTTELAFEDTVDCQVSARTGGVEVNGTFILVTWDDPIPGRIFRPWFSCPCGRRCRFLFLRDRIACRQCFGLQHASLHLRRQTPGVGRVERLRRKLGGCELRPFAPLPARIMRGRSRARHDALVAAIQAEEEALLGHLQKVARDLRRRIELRKARGEW